MPRVTRERFELIHGDRVSHVRLAANLTRQRIGHCAAQVGGMLSLQVRARIGKHAAVHPIDSTMHRAQQASHPHDRREGDIYL